MNDYVSRGELSGGEVASILNEAYETEYYGIEAQTLYNQNKEAFIKALDQNPKIDQALNEIETQLEAETKTSLSNPSRTFYEQKKSFKREEIDLVEYLKSLKEL